MPTSPRFAAILAVLAVSGVPVCAQHRGTIELGAFGRYDFYDNAMGLDDATGFGGRLGFFLSSKVVLESDAGLTATKAGTTDVDHKPLHVRLLGNLPFGKRLAFLLGGGWSYNSYGNGWSATENGVGGLAGLRLSLGKDRKSVV